MLFTLGPEQGRLALDEAQSGRVRKHPVDMEDLTITDGPSVQVALRILRPQHAQAPLPVIVYIHGTGWVFGSTQTHDRLVRELAVGAPGPPSYSRCTVSLPRSATRWPLRSAIWRRGGLPGVGRNMAWTQSAWP